MSIGLSAMNERDLATILSRARQLMAEALHLLDDVQAWEPSAHLDLAIQRLDALLDEDASTRRDH